MSTVLAEVSSIPSVEGLTRYTLLSRLATATGLLQTGTITAGTTEYFEDTTRLKSIQYSPKDWVGGWVRISQTSDNAAPETDICPIEKYDPELGRVTINPRFSASVAAGDKYELWRIDPSIVLRIIDEALTRDLTIGCWSMLSEVPDSDMEQNNTTYWTASGATVTKQTGEPKLSLSGKRFLRVVSASAGDYAESATLNIEPGKAYWFGAIGRAKGSSTTAKVILYDKTNSAEIASISSSRQIPVRMGTWATIPSNCYQVSIRLACVESGKTTEWDEVTFFCNTASDIAAPWWTENPNEIEGIFQLNAQSLVSNIYDVELRGEIDSRFDVYPSRFGGAKYRVVARVGNIHWPLFCYGSRRETAYADDNTDIKYLDSAYFLSCVKWKVYEYLTQPLVTGILQNFDAKSKLPMFKREFEQLRAVNNPTLREIINSPTPTTSYLDSRFRYGA